MSQRTSQNDFARFIEASRRFGFEDLARNFGGVPEAIVSMLDSPAATELMAGARRHIEFADPLPWGAPRLRRMEFGLVDEAPEFLNGNVAAVDGTPTLPLRSFSVGQAICVGICSASLRRQPTHAAHCVTAHMLVRDEDPAAVVEAREAVSYGLSATAYLRYWETVHATEIDERYVLLDGTALYEWLLYQPTAVDLYLRLFETKVPMGVIKNIHASNRLGYIGAVLKPGEVYLDQTVADHQAGLADQLREQGARREGYRIVDGLRPLAGKVWRGVAKPRHKAFGFEVHQDHMDDLLRIAAATAHMQQVGHEIPYLLNLVDHYVRTRFRQGLLGQRLQQVLARRGLPAYFDELDERDFRD